METETAPVKIGSIPASAFTSLFKIIFLFKSFLSFFFIVVRLWLSACPNFPPLLSPPPPTSSCHSQSPLHSYVCVSFIHVPSLDPSPYFSPNSPLPPLCSLSVCSLFPCLRFYFAHLFVLLIRFHL